MRRIVRKYPELMRRVNVDVVDGAMRSLSWKKRAQRAIFDFLDGRPWVRQAMERLIDSLDHPRWSAPLYPLYLLISHYHFAAGIRDESRGAVPTRGRA